MSGFLYHKLLSMAGLALLKPATLAKLYEVRRLSSASSGKCTRIQKAKLEHLLRDVERGIPHKKKSRPLTNPQDWLKEFAFLTKSGLNNSPQFRGARPKGRVYESQSGGSTGAPVRFFHDEHYRHWERALKILHEGWAGYRLGERKIFLWGSERDLFLGRESATKRISSKMKNEMWLNAFKMSKDQMLEYIGLLNKERVKLFVAYAESAYELARFAKTEGLEVRPPGAVMTSAGTLYPHMRREIESAMCTNPYDRYGSREVGSVASQCSEREGLHVCPVTHVVEIIDSDGEPCGEGELGEIVVTSLTNRATPFIRYRTGDIAAWLEGSCKCGISWPRIDQVRGRLVQAFYRRDGGIVLPEYFIHLAGVVLNRGQIREFQFIQESFDEIRVRLSFNNVSVEERELFKSALAEKIALVMGSVHVRFEEVDTIPTTPSGKQFHTLSKVPRNGN